VQNSKPKKNQI